MQNANKLPNGPPTCLWLCTPSRQLSKLQLPTQPAVRFFRRGKAHYCHCCQGTSKFLLFSSTWICNSLVKQKSQGFLRSRFISWFHGSFHGPRFQTAMLLVLLQTWRIPNCDWSHTWRPQIQKKTQQPMKKKTEIQNLQKEMTSLNIIKKFCPVAFYQAWTSWRSNPSRQKEVYPWKRWASKYFNIGLLHLLQEEYSKSCLTSHQQISQKGFLYRNSPNRKQYKKKIINSSVYTQ